MRTIFFSLVRLGLVFPLAEKQILGKKLLLLILEKVAL